MHRVQPASSPDSLTSWLAELEPDLHAIAARYRLPAAEFEDLRQETALAFLSHRGSIHSPRGWLLRVFRNRCLLYWRARRRRLTEAVDRALLEELRDDACDRERRDLTSDLRGALERLPVRCRRLLGLRYGLEFSSPQIAARVGSSAATVRQATRRCLSALSRCLVTVGVSESAR